MTYVVTQVTNLFERFRRILGYRENVTPQQYPFMPIVQVNDQFTNQIICSNAERTSSGTTAIITVPSGRVDTWITSIIISFSEGVANG